MIRLPRRLHRWYAHRFGYFWLPCPRCCRMFGGHEKTGPGMPHPTDPRLELTTCARCTPPTREDQP